MRRRPFTIFLHIALALILAGAIVTHFFGIQGKLTLQLDAAPVMAFEKESGPGNGRLPFAVGLDEVKIEYYPATTTPMDFRSELTVGGHRLSVAMNRVGVFRGWRFYQSGISSDSSTLSVSHDPWGTGITYTGYLMLGIGMLGYFLQRNTAWRGMLRKYRRAVPLVALLSLAAIEGHAAESLPAMQRPLAANMGKVMVYWNDRICPMQTMARDVSKVLYGRKSYKSYTPEQILSGWLFYYDQWLRDFQQFHPEPEPKQQALIQWIGTGELFRIYPYLAADGHMEWLSLTGRRPSAMSLEQWEFMQTTMPGIKQLLLAGKNIRANEEIALLRERQRVFAKGTPLPSEHKIEAERWYNRMVRPAAGGVIALCFGLFALIFPLCKPQRARLTGIATGVAAWGLLLYTALSMALLWWISGHVPLSNGPETMMFMGLVAIAGTCCCRDLTLRGALLVVGAMSLFVAAMGGGTPRIGAMMPVLDSPLLSVHVMVVMIAYALFLLMAILAAMALSLRDTWQKDRLTMLNRIILVPAVCLLGAGIFIGAVWANQTWGRYWGWDPKETCALVMWLVYALPIHWTNRRLRVFRNDKVFNIYILTAILTVAFTYFGANYFLSGLHSYA